MVRRNRSPLAQVAAITVAVVLVEMLVLPGAGMYRAFIAGAVAASSFWILVTRLFEVTYPQTVGVKAEKMSRELISEVPDWLAVHDLPLDGRNIDHVIVTPLAVLAVETKWWGAGSRPAHHRRRENAVEQARRNARTLGHLLTSFDARYALPVWPVLLTWGPGADDTRLGPVDIVDGEDPRAWLAAYQTGAISSTLAEEVHAALLQHRARHDAHAQLVTRG